MFLGAVFNLHGGNRLEMMNQPAVAANRADARQRLNLGVHVVIPLNVQTNFFCPAMRACIIAVGNDLLTNGFPFAGQQHGGQ